MILSPESIKEFKAAYKKEFGEELSEKEAYEKLLRLVNFLRAALLPPPIYAKITNTSKQPPSGLDQTEKNVTLEKNI